MSSEIPKPAEIRKTRGYLWRRIISKWPLLIWIAVAVATYQLYQRGVRFERMNGVVIAETTTISALQDGVIATMSVTESGDEVDANEIVVQLDKREAEAMYREKQQELEFEKIELKRKYDSLKNDLLTEQKQMLAKHAGDIARLKILDGSLDKLREQAEANLIPASKFREAQIEAETLRATTELHGEEEQAIQEAIGRVEGLLTELRKFQESDPVSLEILQDQIDRTELRAPTGGTVSQIFFRPGAVVKRGEPIVEIINLKRRGAKGFILEDDADKVSVGMPIYISPTGESGARLYPGKITYVSPEITSTPDVGSSVGGRMIKGREITCSFDEADIALLPNQSVTIHLEKPNKFKLFSFGTKK